MCDGHFIQHLKNTHPFRSRQVSLKGGSVGAPPAVPQCVQILQASNLSAKTYNSVKIGQKKKKKIQHLTLLTKRVAFIQTASVFIISKMPIRARREGQNA